MGLDVVELVMTVEEHYGLTIPDAEARKMRSIGDLHRFIIDHAQPPPDSVEAWTWLRETIEREFAIPADRITPEAWVVRDLGIN